MNRSPESQPKEWFPSHIISGEEHIALLILNQPLHEECKLFVKRNWHSALFHVGVDGGANQLKELSDDEFPLIPELVCGDFDSATSEVLEYYKSKGVSIIHTPDQNETDFTKALRLTDKYLKDRKIEGYHKIHVTEKMMESHVGLIPLGSACKNVTTTGLKWNLMNGKLNFGGLISTCNMFDGSNIVTVATDTPLIWTMELTMDKF